MTTTIFLIRHGQTESNVNGFFTGWTDEDINEAGQIQSRRLARRLAGFPITSVYTSPLRRAYTTAMILAGHHRVEPEASDDLIDIKLGDWQGRPMDEIQRRWPDRWKEWRANPSDVNIPNGENLSQVAERAVRSFDRIVAANPGKQAVIVTHNLIVKVLVAHVLGVPYGINRRFQVSNASLNTVEVTDGSLRLVRLNDTSHLE
ncbi:MAG: histidine phosphatase family protein [Chloroflexota bacterium]